MSSPTSTTSCEPGTDGAALTPYRETEAANWSVRHPLDGRDGAEAVEDPALYRVGLGNDRPAGYSGERIPLRGFPPEDETQLGQSVPS